MEEPVAVCDVNFQHSMKFHWTELNWTKYVFFGYNINITMLGLVGEV